MERKIELLFSDEVARRLNALERRGIHSESCLICGRKFMLENGCGQLLCCLPEHYAELQERFGIKPKGENKANVYQ